MILMLINSRRRNSQRYSDQGPWLDTSQASSSEMKSANAVRAMREVAAPDRMVAMMRRCMSDLVLAK